MAQRGSLKSSTVRDFSGGWNIIDNELTLSPKFAPVLTNIYVAQDGSQKVRQGTRRIAKVSVADDATAYTFGSVSATIQTTNLSTDVEIVVGGSSAITFNLGQRITIAGVVTTYGGIAPGDINGARVVTAANHTTGTYTITAGAAATSSSGPTALDSAATYSRAGTVTTSPIIAIESFDTYDVVVHKSGEISRVDSSGNAELIWDDDIADQSGATGWTAGLTFASYAVFGGPASYASTAANAVPKLLIANGVDRSVVVDFSVAGDAALFVYYNDTNLTGAADAANDSPAGVRYIAAMPKFCVMAGIPGYESILAISDENTPFVWPDLTGGTTYAVSSLETTIDMARIVNVQDPTIRGIARFRDKLVVAFDNAIALVEFGVDTSASPAVVTHQVTEIIDRQGAIAHKSITSIGDDALMADIVGVPSLRQGLYTGGIRTERVSQLIDPEIQALIQNLTVQQGEDFIYSIWNPLDSHYMLFVPDGISGGEPTTYSVFTYVFIPSLRKRAWAKFSGWSFRCACVTQLGRVHLAEGSEIYILGSAQDSIYVDYEDSDAHGASGVSISFDWELPWADFDSRTSIKISKYISLETEGSATFTTRMYTDGIRIDPTDDSDSPALEMEFVGGESGGYGINPQPYGGGRRTDDERLWSWPSKFKIAKLRFSGSIDSPLSFISLSILYTDGGFRR